MLEGVAVKKFSALIALGMAGCGVGAGGGDGPAGLPFFVPIVTPIYVTGDGLLDTSGLLEGNWIISDAAGARSCLVVQELRVSIVDVTCSSNGSGVSSRIFDSAPISQAGDIILLRVTYNLRAEPDRRLRLVFSGELQPDGTFIGLRRDEDLTADEIVPDRFAIMARP